MKNVTEMREELSRVFMAIKSGEIEPSVASELNNAAGKIINSCRVQLDYRRMTKSDTPIPFLE